MFHCFRNLSLLSLLLFSSITCSEVVFKETLSAEAFPVEVPNIASNDLPSSKIQLDISSWPVYELIDASEQAYEAGDYKKAIQYRYWAIKNGDNGFYDLANYYALDGQIDETMYWLSVDAKEGEGTSSRWLERDKDFVELIADPRWPKLKKFLDQSELYWEQSGNSAYQVILPSQYDGYSVPVLVALHGKGSTPESFIGEGYQSLADQLNIVIVALSGITPMGKTSFRWSTNPASNTKHIYRQLDQIFKAHKITSEKMALYGFSQGAQVSLQTLASKPEDWSGALAMSPGLYPVNSLTLANQPESLSGKKIFVTNGENESSYNIDLSTSDIEQLKRLNADVEHLTYPEQGHSFPTDFYEMFGYWVVKILDLKV